MHKNGNSHNCMNMNGMNSANNKNTTVNPNGANYNGFSSNGIVTKVRIKTLWAKMVTIKIL